MIHEEHERPAWDPWFDKHTTGGEAAVMKRCFAVRVLGLALLCSVSAAGVRAQSATPIPTTAPTQPLADTPVSPAPTASVAASPVAEKPQPTPRSAEDKAARKAERLRKYDTNKDGKLDEKERAAMRADKAKASPTP